MYFFQISVPKLQQQVGHPPLGSSLVDSVDFLLEDFIRGSVTQDFPWETVTPGLHIGDLLAGKVINALTLWYGIF